MTKVKVAAVWKEQLQYLDDEGLKEVPTVSRPAIMMFRISSLMTMGSGRKHIYVS